MRTDPFTEVVHQQFALKAGLYASAPALTNPAALDVLLELSRVGAEDTVLDVGCGAGVVVCAFAARARHVTGIDLVPAMIERARALQAEKGLSNVSWQVGDVLPLPFLDHAFTLVVSRYTFHHFTDAGAVLAEMRRVCAPGGRVVVADMMASADPAKAEALNRMERLRDPSHVRAMPLAELEQLFHRAGLAPARQASYGLEFEVEQLLAGSHPRPGDADQVRSMFAESVDTDAMGLGTRREGNRLLFSYPIAVLRAEAQT